MYYVITDEIDAGTYDIEAYGKYSISNALDDEVISAAPDSIDMGVLLAGNYDPVNGTVNKIDGWDAGILANGFGESYPDEPYIANIGADSNFDGTIDGWDMAPISNNFGAEGSILL